MDSIEIDGPSFVILDQPSLNLDNVGSELHNGSDSIASLNIQHRLDYLIQENQQLRDAITQNNLAMKTQFDTLSVWQEEVSKTHQHHKQKFAETRELVLNLRSENEALKKSVTSNIAEESVRRLQSEKLVLVKERDAFREECTRLTLKIADLENTLRRKTDEISNISSLSSKTIDEKESFAKEPERCSGSLSLVDWQCVSPAVHGEAESLKMSLDSKRNEIEGHKKRINELEEKNIKLEEDYKTLEISARKEKDALDLKLESSIKEVVEKTGAIDSLLLKLKELTEKADLAAVMENENGILKTQVEVYSNDYKEEREAREKLAQEKEDFAEQLRDLTNRLGQVQAIRGQTVAPATSASNQPEPDTSTAADAQTVPYNSTEQNSTACPICNLQLGSNVNVNVHVNKCLDRIMYMDP